MRTAAAAAVLLALLGAASARAEEDAPRRMTWEGYLFQDAEGRTRLGWPVIAMGVMAMPPHVVAKPEADRLAPLLAGAKGDYVLWNYELEKADDAAFRRLPRYLVRLEGMVTGKDASIPFGGDGGPLTMTSARLLLVEILPEAWVRAWAGAFREGMPFRIDVNDAGFTRERARETATKALALLRTLRAVPPATDAERAVVAKIDPAARVVETHRRETEWGIQRWVVEADARHALALPGLAELGRLPPTNAEVERWFLEAKTKAEFLAKVRAAWDGPLDTLYVGYYETGPNWASYRSIDVERLESAWDDAAFVRHRDATVKTLGR
jgi:hypothetical protein